MFRYIDDVRLSLNYCKFCDFVDRLYPIELEIKDTTYTARSASYLDLDNEGQLIIRTNFTTKDMISNLSIVNFPFICGIIQHLYTEYASLS